MKQILIILLLLAFSSVSFGQSKQSIGKTTLKGIKNIEVVVEKIRFESFGISDQQIKNDTEIRLREAGIEIAPTDTVSDDTGILHIHLQVFPSKVSKGYYIYNNKIQLIQNAYLARSPKEYAFATTYDFPATFGAVSESNIKDLKEVIEGRIDLFIKEYFEMNPKP